MKANHPIRKDRLMNDKDASTKPKEKWSIEKSKSALARAKKIREASSPAEILDHPATLRDGTKLTAQEVAEYAKQFVR